jgi:hypothetical protein
MYSAFGGVIGLVLVDISVINLGMGWMTEARLNVPVARPRSIYTLLESTDLELMRIATCRQTRNYFETNVCPRQR